MRYALLLHLDPEVAGATTPEEADAELAAYATITQELQAAGVLLGGEALMPAQTATIVRVQGDRRLTVPAPSTDLELSGFYIVDCDEQQAIDIAARLPVATHGAVEVRALMDLAAGVS